MNWKRLGKNVQIHDPHLSIFLKPEMISIADGARLDGLIKIEGGMGCDIGPGVHISSFAHLNIGGGSLIVGANVALTSGVKVVTGSNTERGEAMSSAAPPEMQVVERKQTVIEECVFVGANAVILPGVRIGHHAIVGAGAVVTKDVPAHHVVMGVPACFVRMRSKWEIPEAELEDLSLFTFSQ